MQVTALEPPCVAPNARLFHGSQFGLWLPPTDDEKRRNNTTEQYAALGRFVEAFELMVDEVREICVDCIYKVVCKEDKNTKRDDETWEEHFAEILTQKKFIEIPLHHQNMAAKALFDVMRAIVAEIVNKPSDLHYADRDKFKNVLGCIEKEYGHLQNKRNEMLHATWFIGYVSFDDPNSSEFMVRKYKTTADGVKRSELPKNAQELLDLVERCDETRTWLAHIVSCLNDTSIDTYFRQEKSGEPWKLFMTEDSAGTTLPKK